MTTYRFGRPSFRQTRDGASHKVLSDAALTNWQLVVLAGQSYPEKATAEITGIE
jgi:hypothetical protein